MNREMRRLMEREERRQKKQQKDGRRPSGPVMRRPGAPGERKSAWQRLLHFLREVRVELKRVSWPTRQQMVNFTTVTLITSLALTLVIFALDVALKEAVLFVIGGA
jgi:preprotein translocase subunit SecE